jgi:hypothetical protein
MRALGKTGQSIFSGILLFFFLIGNLNAQEVDKIEPVKNEWTFLVEPYLLFPMMKGNVGIGILPDATLEASASDIFSNLKMGFMLNAEASNGTWTIGSDFLYMRLGQDVEPSVLIENGEVRAKQLGWEIFGLYRVLPWLELGLGGLVSSVKAEVSIDRKVIGGGTTTLDASKTETWFDPMLIARIKNSGLQQFVYQFKGEIGGFGIGSDLAWQIQAYGGYRFSELFEMTAGYRIISLDYETGSGQGRFMYDVDTSGPVIRFGFNF